MKLSLTLSRTKQIINELIKITLTLRKHSLKWAQSTLSQIKALYSIKKFNEFLLNVEH